MAPVACAEGQVVLPTHPVHNAMRRGLLTFLPQREETVKTRVRGQVRLLRVRTGFVLRSPQTREAIPHDANLLKTHLDLLDQAYRRSHPEEGFWYDLPEALARLGYKRLEGGGFHADTYQALQQRLGELARAQVSLDRVTGDRVEPYRHPEQYWRFFFLKRGAEELHPLSDETDLASLRQIRRLLAIPGAWWSDIDLANYRLPLPRALMTLPMDGKGHQVHRIALMLAAELAVWERTEMRKGAHVIARSLGPLLEKAMVADKEALLADMGKRLNTPKRLREYLAGEGFHDEGALALLRMLGGFKVDIKDEEAFWGVGRQWVERFWGARLSIGVREFKDPTLSARALLPLVSKRDRPLATSPTAIGE
jgi:hypothetical protein